MTLEPHPEFDAIYQKLLKALNEGYHEQLALLAATDETYAFIEAESDRMTDQQYLDARMLLSQAEALLTRYFGM